MMKSPFIQPRFVGKRFLEHTLPVDVAKDLAAYESLVIELAKHIYLQENSDRQRVPKGFSAEFHLHIERIEDGSARPLLSVIAAGTLALSGGSADYFERSRDLISECIASEGVQLPNQFPRELLSHFNQFGRSLRDDESLELPRSSTTPAILTPDIRKKLVLAADRVYEKEIELSGTISEADWDKSTFRIRLPDGSQSVVPMPENFHAKAREFGGRGRHQVVVNGVAAFDSWDRLQKVVSVDSLEIQRNFELVKRLDALSCLKDGWFDGQGLAPDRDKLLLLSEKLETYYPERIPLPTVVPTQEGNLLFEWDTVGSPSLDIAVDSLTADFHAFDANGIDIEKCFRLSEDAEWLEFSAYLEMHVEGERA